MFRRVSWVLEQIRRTLCFNEFTIENYFIKKGYKFGRGNKILIRDLGGEPYLIKIGNQCTIATGVRFVNHDGGTSIFRREKPDLESFGKIEIKDNCFIGIGSIILPNVTIGPNSVVGAGSVVTHNVPPNTVVAGSPARIICSVEEYKKKCYQKWKEIDLKGPRSMWRKQLEEYFWGEGQ